MQELESNEKKSPFAKWIKRFGFAGFLFFFIKGLLWLIVPALLIWFGFSA
ncbi:MAG: hypothetical protein ACR2MD_01685 [Aridibacter sp.]